jgi:hypothetical protein
VSVVNRSAGNSKETSPADATGEGGPIGTLQALTRPSPIAATTPGTNAGVAVAAAGRNFRLLHGTRHYYVSMLLLLQTLLLWLRWHLGLAQLPHPLPLLVSQQVQPSLSETVS